ncbi:putative leucine-rich repeat-containing protein DDB_G0290503 [Leptopilina heterotoma]|uniref:putative leucine-rich repeat-containing protein DDB_G0290503 n=1 Tax=Leptopilina heterotoma TaxID=63436 RepID=UPI001CA8B176|nr:putative leucine-rich repeat-containing protein DDB_G0290503 [Leptopilina heterotoma]XP_043462590.1 putative leucine-rich repeat-containing protein DDB_G0290503 [Leptopilina heterotoma]
MDSFSDSSRCELDSTTSGDSLLELRPHSSSLELLNSDELIKRTNSLELANERLRYDLDNLQIELNTKISVNESLKEKITLLYVDAQSALQEKRKIENNFKNLQSQLIISENSTKWYQEQLHQAQASKKTLQIEVNTYQEMLKQKQQLVTDIILKSSKLNQEYVNLISKYKDEKEQLQNEINQRFKRDNFSKILAEDRSLDISANLKLTEEELHETKIQLCRLEEKLINSEIEKTCLENTNTKQLSTITSLEDNCKSLKVEKNKLKFNLQKSHLDIEKYKNNSETAEFALNNSKQNQIQVEAAISELQIQLSKMLTQYKLLRARNYELEEKVTSMRKMLNETKRLKLLSFNANSSLLQKLKREKQRSKKLENFSRKRQNNQRTEEANKTDNSGDNSLQQDVNKNKKQLKSMTRVLEESIDEGYADGISLGPSTNLPSTPALNPVLLLKINDILYKSKNLMSPIQEGINELQMKIEKFKEEQNNKFLQSSTNFYNNRSISTVSSPNNTRTLV